MSVENDLEGMSTRLIQGEGSRVSKRIKIYKSGVLAKLRQAEYAHKIILDLSNQTDLATTTQSDEFTVTDKIHFFVDSFFAFIYSTFDVISQVANQKLRLSIDERQVSFKRVNDELARSHSGTSVQRAYQQLFSSKFFKNLDRYRNCSTHRRQIYIREETVWVSETPGYSATGDITTVRRVICDDPLTLNPRISRNRELVSYTSEMLDRAKSAISRIANNL